jgi:hypothetical protein
MASPTKRLRCRQIERADVAAVVALLTRGFPARGRGFWIGALAQLTRRQPPLGQPQYGYLMESEGMAVGVLLVICAMMPDGDGWANRCNLSSWYVDPPFRPYAHMLVAKAIRDKEITYLNVSPAPQTHPIIEAQGFSRYSFGTVTAVPVLSRVGSGVKVGVLEASQQPEAKYDPRDQQILAAHARYGCVSLWCVADGRASPFVFRPRLIRGVVPGAQLIYCGGVDDFARFAGPLGRALMRRGLLLVVLDANERLPGLFGWYRAGNRPKYFKGPRRPRVGDLAYTEYAVMGV